MVRPTQQALLARRIGKVKLGLFAHRSYIAAFGMPKTPADIGGIASLVSTKTSTFCAAQTVAPLRRAVRNSTFDATARPCRSPLFAPGSASVRFI